MYHDVKVCQTTSPVISFLGISLHTQALILGVRAAESVGVIFLVMEVCLKLNFVRFLTFLENHRISAFYSKVSSMNHASANYVLIMPQWGYIIIYI